MDKITEHIVNVIKENLRIEFVEWHDGSIGARLFWGDTMFYESKATVGKFNE